MEKIELLKDIASIAAPLSKTLVDHWLSPKIKFLISKAEKSHKIQDHYFDNKFKDYLIEKYKTYSILNILAFRNQQRLLDDIYLPLTLIESKSTKPKKYKILDFSDDFIPKYKKVLITDTAGMGKSTLSRKLFLSVIKQNKGIPILIELRRLSNSRKIIDEIFDELKLLESEQDSEFILELIKRGDFVFFLDGYDEIASSEKKQVTEDIQKFISNASNNNFFLTSRPDGALASFGQFQSFFINPLQKSEVYALLKKYDGNSALSKSLIEKIKGENYRDLDEFLTNPLLVSLLYTAYEYKHTIPLKKHIFYRQVYDALFEAHDLSKGDYYQREKFSKLGIDDFHTITRYISFLCLKLDKIEFTKDEILDVINNAKVFCEIIEFENSNFLKDLITTVPLFVQEGMYYKWTHKSIYEYFVTQFIYLDSGEKRNNILRGLVNKNQNANYNNILDIYSNVDFKTFREIIAKEIIIKFINFCNTTYKNLNINLDEKDIIERQELTFDRDEILIQLAAFKDKNKDFDYGMTECFKIINSDILVKDKGYGIRLGNLIKNNIEKGNYTFAFSSHKDDYTVDWIMYLLSKREDTLIKPIQIKTIPDLRKFNIRNKIIHKIHDKKDSVLNKNKEYFTAVNTILKGYYHKDSTFDYQECVKFLNEVNNEDKIRNQKEFLSF